MRIAVVIVHHLAPRRTVAAAGALATSRRSVDAVVVVDNGGAHADALRADLPGATVVTTPRNLGFAGGANAGIRVALAGGAGAVLLLNDDATLADDALEQLERALAQPGVGIVGPAVVGLDGERVESLGLSFTRWSGRLRELGRGTSLAAAALAPRTVDGVSGCAMLVSRAVLDAVGAFDERFFFYFEDLDLCLRARRAGWRTVVVPRAVVRHEGSATIGKHSPRRVYHAVRGHLRLGQGLGGPGTFLRQAAIVGWTVAHVVRRGQRYERGAFAAAVQGVLDHLRRAPEDESMSWGLPR